MRRDRGPLLYRGLLALGIGLMCVALVLAAGREVGERRAKQESAQIMERLEDKRPQLYVPTAASDQAMPTERFGSYDYLGSVVIPVLGVDLPVAVQISDDSLRLSPCRYSGSYRTDDLIVCGEGYRAHFGRLGTVGIRDEVWIVAVDGALYRYLVSNVERTAMEAIDKVMDDWDLTLFTFNGDGSCCVVRCIRASEG